MLCAASSKRLVIAVLNEREFPGIEYHADVIV
jgi:hypothetical protein